MLYLLCTGNPGKAKELRALLPPGIELATLADFNLPKDLPETGRTFTENALQKARLGHLKSGLPAIADDSGLEVEALDGAPGVDTAFYAGPEKDDKANVAKLLGALRGEADRRARFRTVIALVDEDGEHLFEGEVQGRIAMEARGTNGFGYDPVFMPESSEFTFGELPAETKNAISHRSHAVWKLARFLAERE
ncbi:MAG: RdgB/HAM1 family non-canonical purine NTP pyrophosphatase [Flavobacteriales bacterium]|nr:RdgB/HAM1 family non-canonical purine NTP pyrophosphatase [Flavobacteriales bacterium]